MTMEKMKTIIHMKTTTNTSCQSWIHPVIVLVIVVLTSAHASDTSGRDHHPGSTSPTPVRAPRASNEVACRENLCKNGGTCEPYTDGATKKWYCNCPDTFSGRHCEKKISVACREDYCENGGTCGIVTEASTMVVSLYCHCPKDFTGNRCEKKVTHSCSRPHSIYLKLENIICAYSKDIKQGDMFTVNCSAYSMGRDTRISREGSLLETVTLQRMSESLANHTPDDIDPLLRRTKKHGLPKNMIISYYGMLPKNGMAAGISMTITNATCADQVEYKCLFKYLTHDDEYDKTATFRSTPNIQDCPVHQKPMAPDDASNDARNTPMVDPMLCLLVASIVGLINLLPCSRCCYCRTAP